MRNTAPHLNFFPAFSDTKAFAYLHAENRLESTSLLHVFNLDMGFFVSMELNSVLIETRPPALKKCLSNF